MSTPSNPLPEALSDYAATTAGPYAERFGLILRHAFTHHQLMLSAHQVRLLAGGGSNSTAQEAVEAFRSEVHRMASEKMTFGADIPASVANLGAQLLEQLVVTMRQEAAQAWATDRASLEQGLASAKADSASLQEALSGLQAELQLAIDEARDARHDARASADALASAQAELADARSRLSVLEEADAQHRVQVTALERARQDLLDAHERERSEARSAHTLAMDSLRQEAHARTTQLQRSISEANQTAAGLREELADAGIAKARAEQQLAVQKAAADAAAQTYARQIDEMREAARARDLEWAERLAAASFDTTLLLGAIARLDPSALPARSRELAAYIEIVATVEAREKSSQGTSKGEKPWTNP